MDEVLIGELATIDVIIAHLVQHDAEELQLRVGIFLFRALDGRKVDLCAYEKIRAKQSHERAIQDTSFHIDTISVERTIICLAQIGKGTL